MAEERERVRRQLALETKRRRRLFEEKARAQQEAEEELVRPSSPPRERSLRRPALSPHQPPATSATREMGLARAIVRVCNVQTLFV